MNKELRFDKRFANNIRDGKKLQTIRREFDPKYTTISCMVDGFAIIENVPVRKVEKITIGEDCFYKKSFSNNVFSGIIDPSINYNFAVKEGFDNWGHLIEYIGAVYELPFTGVLIEWRM